MPSSTFYTTVAFAGNDQLIVGGGRYATPAFAQGLLVKYNNAGTITAQRLFTNGTNNVVVESVYVLQNGNVLLAVSDDTGDTIMLLDPTLQTFIWSRNIGLVGSIQSMVVDGTHVYINCSTHIAKIEIGGDVLWVTGKTNSYSNVAVNPTTGDLVVVSGIPSGSTTVVDRTLWVYTLSGTTGEYVSGTSIEFDGITSDNIIGFVSIVPSTTGYVISASGANTTIMHINDTLSALAWSKQLATGFGSMSLRVIDADIYLGGRAFNQHLLLAAKLTSVGDIVWQKQWSLPSNTLDSWWTQGRDMMDVTPTRVALCGWTEDITTPVFVQHQSATQGTVVSFVNNTAFTYNTISNPTHVVNSTYTSTPITAPVIFTPVLSTFFGITPIAAAAGAP